MKLSSRWPLSARSPAEHHLGGVYRVLGGLLLVVLGAALLLPANTVVQQFAPGMATELFGIIITVMFVQQLLYRQERARRMRASIGAYRRAGWALSGLVTAWADTIKGCSTSELPRSLDRIFAPHLTECLARLDPGAITPAGGRGSWGTWLAAECEQLTSQLNRVILSYSGVLDPAYMEAVDELIDHAFIKLVAELAGRGADAREWRTAMNGHRGYRDDFFQGLVATVHLHNGLAAEAAQTRCRRRGPRTSALGMELPRDHDLHIRVEFGSAWQQKPPRADSLAAEAERVRRVGRTRERLAAV